MVHASSPTGRLGGLSAEVVQRDVGGVGNWVTRVLDDIGRFGSLVVGPGVGADAAVRESLGELIRASPIPVVVDGDGLLALLPQRSTSSATGPNAVLATPHDGEFERLAGHPPGPDRVAAARSLAARLGCTVLLKGPVTIVAGSSGAALAVAEGDQRLATAGTGDVLAGIAGALLAQGLDPLRAGAAAAWLHGRAGRTLPPHGMIASDLADALPAIWADMDEDES
jgi:NAD(P)H-hydrate epimerase